MCPLDKLLRFRFAKRNIEVADYSSLAFWLRFQTMPVCSLELNPSFS
jgi:hypothetical protein